jgi:serine protease AprX
MSKPKRVQKKNLTSVDGLEDELGYIVYFPNTESRLAALASESLDNGMIKLTNQNRNFVLLEPSTSNRHALTEVLRYCRTEFGAEILPDIQFELDHRFRPDQFEMESLVEQETLDLVHERLKTQQAWEYSKGSGVTIAVVDTGVSGERKEFESARKVGGWARPGVDPWTDDNGHGTMCATIALGAKIAGGKYNGVAPKASLISCRTTFRYSELISIYDYLASRALAGEKIIATNSWGSREPADPRYVQRLNEAISDAIDAGVIFVFSAGNYHTYVGGLQENCSPNSIFDHKNRTDILTVGTCKLNGEMWPYSSRGSNKELEQKGFYKPDVVAPTPQKASIAYGAKDKILETWGTSGAAPMVAGLAALIASLRREMTNQQVLEAIKNCATNLGHHINCQGKGLISCLESVKAVASNA